MQRLSHCVLHPLTGRYTNEVRMRIDLEYIATILNVFIASETAHITIYDIENSGVAVYDENHKGLNQKFVFHAQLLVENSLVSDSALRSDSLNTFGITLQKNSFSVMPKDIRLTQQGHDFANALANKEVRSTLTDKFKDAPFQLLFSASQKIMEHVLLKQVDAFL